MPGLAKLGRTVHWHEESGNFTVVQFSSGKPGQPDAAELLFVAPTDGSVVNRHGLPEEEYSKAELKGKHSWVAEDLLIWGVNSKVYAHSLADGTTTLAGDLEDQGVRGIMRIVVSPERDRLIIERNRAWATWEDWLQE